MGGKSKSGRYIESFEVEFKVHEKIRELAKKDRITVGVFSLSLLVLIFTLLFILFNYKNKISI